MNKEELRKKTQYCLYEDQQQIIAEFEKQREAVDAEILLSSQRAYEIKSLEKENERLTEGLEYHKRRANVIGRYADGLRVKAEALERICEPITKGIEHDGYDVMRGIRKDIGLIRLARYPDEIPQTLERICDYLDSQPIEFDCAECGKTLTVSHECKGKPKIEYDWMCKPTKPKDEEVLRGILASKAMVCGGGYYTTAGLSSLLAAILEHFQLREGE